VFLNLGAEVLIGDNVAIGQQVMILTDSHAIGTGDRRADRLYSRGVCVGNGVWLGARALLLPGVTIGDRAVIAAGAVVHDDIPPNSLAGGVPARVLRVLGD
jgi:acetyltransferase-like isoleucine patch superfamily enzyme